MSPAALALQRRERLDGFQEVYEDLVEVVCDAANYGPSPALEGRYAELKEPYVTAYAGVQAFLDRFLDANVALRQPFMHLTIASSLRELIESDHGWLIPDIMQTRMAIVAYGEHLKAIERRDEAR